jgi:hypothetical protein
MKIYKVRKWKVAKLENVTFLFLHRKKNGDLEKCKVAILHFLILELLDFLENFLYKNIFIRILLEKILKILKQSSWKRLFKYFNRK